MNKSCAFVLKILSLQALLCLREAQGLSFVVEVVVFHLLVVKVRYVSETIFFNSEFSLFKLIQVEVSFKSFFRYRSKSMAVNPNKLIGLFLYFLPSQVFNLVRRNSDKHFISEHGVDRHSVGVEVLSQIRRLQRNCWCVRKRSDWEVLKRPQELVTSVYRSVICKSLPLIKVANVPFILFPKVFSVQLVYFWVGNESLLFSIKVSKGPLELFYNSYSVAIHDLNNFYSVEFSGLVCEDVLYFWTIVCWKELGPVFVKLLIRSWNWVFWANKDLFLL